MAARENSLQWDHLSIGIWHAKFLERFHTGFFHPYAKPSFANAPTQAQPTPNKYYIFKMQTAFAS